jgi:hypothetical protein
MIISQQREYPWVVWISILLSFILVCCSSNGANNQGELFIKVVDAPASYQQLNIVVDRVSIHQTGTGADVGWTYVNTNSSEPIDLLNLRNGRNYQLVLNKVPVGTYDHIEINYGPCTLTIEGLQYQLNLDPTVKFGQSIPYGFQIVEGQQLQLTFDFNSYSSVYTSGALNSYYFKPVIRIQNTLLSGWILGSVVRPDTLPNGASVRTFTGVDSVITTCDPNGSFQISDLPENTYTVTILSNDPKLKDTTITNITVVRRQGYILGAIKLSTK